MYNVFSLMAAHARRYYGTCPVSYLPWRCFIRAVSRRIAKDTASSHADTTLTCASQLTGGRITPRAVVRYSAARPASLTDYSHPTRTLTQAPHVTSHEGETVSSPAAPDGSDCGGVYGWRAEGEISLRQGVVWMVT